MTKKNYELISAAMASAMPSDHSSKNYRVARNMWLQCCQSLCNSLGVNNAKFDRERFLLACRGKAGPEPIEQPPKPVKLKSQYKG